MARAKPNNLNNLTDNRRVAVYARKSKITETGKSIEVQKEKCIALACAQFDIPKEELLIYEDEGKSGFYADRPQYMKMLRDIGGNKIKAVVCYKIDRISRRTVDLLNLVQQMEQNGIAFISVSDRELDTTSRTGKIMVSLLSAIAEFERDILAERITDNLYELAKEGRWLGGRCPLGFYSKKEKLLLGGKKTTVNHLAPIEGEQRAVKKIFDQYIKCGSLSATARVLNKEGIRTKQGNNFTLIAVKNILQNPVYAIADADTWGYFNSLNVPLWSGYKDFDGVHGLMAYNKTEQTKELDVGHSVLGPKYIQKALRRDIKEWVVAAGKHKGLVDGNVWVRVQNIISEASQEKSARPKESSKALLSGLIMCTACGGKMFVRAESGRYNPDGSLRFKYICGDKYRNKGGCKKSQNIKGYDLDNFVMGAICGIIACDNKFFNNLLKTKNLLLKNSREAENEESELKKRVLAIESYIQNQTLNLREAPSIIKQSIFDDIEALSKEKADKEARLGEMQKGALACGIDLTGIEKIKQDILCFNRMINVVGYESRLQLFRQVLGYVKADGGTLHIFLKDMSHRV
ncbi:MAG: recombinase family protein [Clostridiales bacterium]|jgi:site-specific DNA recombinase|nr:recombinase family protein [Clostridiales bacterium]